MKQSPFHARLKALLEAGGWAYSTAYRGYHHEGAGYVASVQGQTAARIERVGGGGGPVHVSTDRRIPEAAAEDLAAKMNEVARDALAQQPEAAP